MKNAVLRALVLDGALLLSLSGCGTNATNQGDISGEVKLDGRPLTEGSITFTPTEATKGIVRGGRIENGCYRLMGKAGPTIGWNRVEIHAVRKTGKPAPQTNNPLEIGGEDVEEAVAPQYNTESTLTVEIRAGSNTSDFVVSSK